MTYAARSALGATAFLLSLACAARAQTAPEPPWRSRVIAWDRGRSESPSWQSDPRLQGRSAPGYPDDFQVLFDNPDDRDEIMWVRVIAHDRATDLFLGILLNEPALLRTPLPGDNVVFRFETGSELPVAVASPTYGDAGWPPAAPGAFQTVLRDGVRAYRVGNYGHNRPGIERCIEVLRPVMRDVPANASTFDRFVGHYILGRCAAEVYDTPLAIEQFRAAIALDPDDADAHLALLAEYSVMVHRRPGELSAEEEAQWERSFLDQLALVRERFAEHPGVSTVLAFVFDPAQEANVEESWLPHIAKLRRVGYGIFRWKIP